MNSGGREPPCVLHVAEKPSLAAAIAGILSRGQHSTRRAETEVHEFQHPFRGRPARFRVTAVKGHCFNLDFEEAYRSWDRPPEQLFSAGTVKVPTSGAVLSHLRNEAAGCSHLVLWLDCDREGENSKRLAKLKIKRASAVELTPSCGWREKPEG